MTRMHTCQYHCRGCDSHFSSLQAFDLHRVGEHDNRPDNPRRCNIPTEEVSDENGNTLYEYVVGECRDAFYPEVKEGLIWTLYGARDRAKAVAELYANH
jgi:hypothetical protein